MKKSFDHASVFKEWKGNLENNPTLPVVTTSALIKLSELKAFVKDLERLNADSVRIHLLRFRWNDEPQGKRKGVNAQPLEGCEWTQAGRGLTQVALALGPTKNYTVDANFIVSAEDIVQRGKILLLMPGGEKVNAQKTPEGPSGHNPPSKK